MAKFVLLRGAIGWGASLAVLFSLLQWKTFGGYAAIFEMFPFIIKLTLPLGAVWGIAVWTITYTRRASAAHAQRQFVERWKAIRGQGAWRYVLLRGVLGAGFGLTALISMIDWHYGTLSLTIGDLLVRLPIQILGVGLLFGWMSWFFSEQKYRELAPQFGDSRLVAKA